MRTNKRRVSKSLRNKGRISKGIKNKNKSRLSKVGVTKGIWGFSKKKKICRPKLIKGKLGSQYRNLESELANVVKKIKMYEKQNKCEFSKNKKWINKINNNYEPLLPKASNLSKKNPYNNNNNRPLPAHYYLQHTHEHTNNNNNLGGIYNNPNNTISRNSIYNLMGNSVPNSNSFIKKVVNPEDNEYFKPIAFNPPPSMQPSIQPSMQRSTELTLFPKYKKK